MFNQNPFSSQDTISLPLFLRQSMIFGFLEWRLTVLMQFCQTLVASICQKAKVFGEITSMILEQLKIVFASISKSRGNNFGALSVGNYLCFLGRSLLFATVMTFLAFFGRSTGCSLTSTNTTSKTVSLDWRTFLPGRRNLPDRTKMFSTFRFPYGSTDCRLADTLGVGNMELRPILSPVHQGHQQLICSTQLGWSTEVSQPFFNHCQHSFKGCALHACQSFEVSFF